MESERRRALEILRDVREGERAEESFARRSAGLDSRQRAFLMELAYGAIRWRRRLDYHLGELLEGDRERLPPDVVSILELGAYQILFLDRVPVWSAVDESVRLARAVVPARSARWASGLVNGVLRNLARRRDTLGLPAADDSVAHLAVRYSHPDWMVARWIERYGAQTTEALLIHNNEPPRLHLAVHLRLATPGAVLEAIREAGHEARLHPLKRDAIVVGPGAHPEELPGWAEGHFWVQDTAAQWVVEMAAPQAGAAPPDRFLDACAAPGGKLCGLLAKGGEALAADFESARLGRIRQNCERLGLGEPWIVAADARAMPVRGRFPLVLADVPCTGTGVLRRRVDARWRRRPGDVARFASLQREILDGLAEHVLPGGALVYATCSIEIEENEEVVAAFLATHGEFRLDPAADRVPPALRDGSYLATCPWTGDHDGMFAARLLREAA